MEYQASVLALREELWRETSRTAETSSKLDELRILSQEIAQRDAVRHRFETQLQSHEMQIGVMKDVASGRPSTRAADRKTQNNTQPANINGATAMAAEPLAAAGVAPRGAVPAGIKMKTEVQPAASVVMVAQTNTLATANTDPSVETANAPPQTSQMTAITAPSTTTTVVTTMQAGDIKGISAGRYGNNGDGVKKETSRDANMSVYNSDTKSHGVKSSVAQSTSIQTQNEPADIETNTSLVLEAFATASQTKLKELNILLTQGREACKPAEEELEVLAKKLKDTQAQVESKSKHNRELSAKNKATATELETIKAQVAELNVKAKNEMKIKAEQERARAATEEKNACLKKIVDIAQRRAQESEASVVESIAELKILRREVKERQHEVNGAWREMLTAKKQRNFVQADLKARDKEVEDYLNRCKATFAKAAKRCNNLEENQAKLQTEFEEYETAQEEAEAETEELKEQIKQVKEVLEKQKQEFEEQATGSSEKGAKSSGKKMKK